jgi:large subunit ribosomal protein L2
MGKRIRAQRKGRGGMFKATQKSKEPSSIPILEEATSGRIVDLIHNPGRGSPLAKIVPDKGETFHVAAPEGSYVGQSICINHSEKASTGDILPLEKIPPGTLICHLEKKPGDGGVFARSSGTYVQVIGAMAGGVEVKLPSGKTTVLDAKCRSVVGVVGATGRTEKPFLKAGKRVHWYRAKAGKRYPVVRGVAMNPVDHPYGGGAHQHVGKSKSVSGTSPPGKKVGSFRSRRTGRKKRR